MTDREELYMWSLLCALGVVAVAVGELAPSLRDWRYWGLAALVGGFVGVVLIAYRRTRP